MEINNTVKQVLVIRKDLKNTDGHKVRSGKVQAQACHASEAWIFNRMEITPSGIMGSKGVYTGLFVG